MERKMVFFGLFISVFYAVGIGMACYGVSSAVRSTAAGRWPTAPGVVKQCSVQSRSGGKGDTTYEVKAQYTYSVGGKQYAGSRVAFGYSGSSGRDAHQQICDAITKADGVAVRYNPANPAVSTLSWGIHRSIQFTLAFAFTWLAFVVGFTIIWWLSSRPDTVLLRNLITR